jgi:hypothetical protein
VQITDSTISTNRATAGVGGIPAGLPGSGIGGGIYNASSGLTITNCTFAGNSADAGGGISNAGTGTVTNSTLYGNSAAPSILGLSSPDRSGGGIYNFHGALTVSNSTLSGNSARYLGGGGIHTNSTLPLTLTSVTLTANQAGRSVGGLEVGGGLDVAAGSPVLLRNTLIAGNFGILTGTRADVFGALQPAGGHNLIGDGTGMTGLQSGVNGNQVGSAATPLDPRLGPLQNNGGSTLTMALLAGSPAIGAGDPTDAPPWDQRGPGFPRVVNGTMDIGAFEGVHQPTSLVGRDAATGQWWVGLSSGSSFTNVLAGAWDPSATWMDVQTGDFNGDGREDIIGRDLHTGAWWVGLSDGHGHFTTTLWDVWSPAVHWVDVKVGAFTGDGQLAIAGRVQEDGSWWVGRSTGTSFVTSRWGAWSPAVPWEDVRVGDLTGSGKADLLGRTPNGQWWAALSSGASFTNTLWTTWAPDLPNLTWADVQLVDVNGDGKADLVGRWLQTGQWWVSLSAGSVAGSTQLWDIWSPAVTWVDVHVGDFTGDGKAALVGRDLASGTWWVDTSTGTVFADRVWARWSPAVTWADVQVGDFNADGRVDIAGRAPDGSWWVGLSSGSSFVTTRWGGWYPGLTWADVHTGQFG